MQIMLVLNIKYIFEGKKKAKFLRCLSIETKKGGFG